MNVFGAIGFTINGWWHRALPSAALNVVWMMIGAITLWRIWTRGKSGNTVATRDGHEIEL
jgi:hypothetical protein